MTTRGWVDRRCTRERCPADRLRVTAPGRDRLLWRGALQGRPDQPLENENRAVSNETLTRTIRQAGQKGDLGSKMKEVEWSRVNLRVSVRYRPKAVVYDRQLSVGPIAGDNRGLNWALPVVCHPIN